MVTFYFEDLHDDANCMRHFGLLASDKHPAGKGLLMQSTGLTDKNGVEIFESDVVTLGHGKLIASIEYDHAGLILRHIKGSPLIQFSEWGDTEPIYRNCDISTEVIGNIYENPGLLKGADDE